MVYVKNLNKNIIPFFVAPYQDELFSSWIYRMSLKSGIKPIKFCNSYFKNIKGFWNRDIDLSVPSQIVKYLSEITPLTEEDIFRLSLRRYDGLAYEKLNINSYTYNITALGINHRKRKKFGLLYCSNCLLKVQYYKTQWRLETSIVCLKCKKYLQDRCPACKVPISFHRINFNNKGRLNSNLSCCSNCSYDLSKDNSHGIPTSEDIQYQKFINDTIKFGYNSKSSYSFSYIKVLLLLCAKLNTSNQTNQFKINFKELYKINQTNTSNYFRFLSIKERRNLLVQVNQFLMNWPNSIFEIKSLNRFNNSHIIDNMGRLPYWFTYYLKFS